MKIRSMTPLPPLEIDKPPTVCVHTHGVTLDAEVRTATCKGCGRVIDSFTALMSLAKNWESYRARRDHATRMAEAAEARLKALLKEEANCKARISAQRRKIRPVFGEAK